jgi:hypothetical protein
MKKLQLYRAVPLLVFIMSFTFLSSCTDDDNTDNENVNQTITESDEAALIFMLEEEKLARDTYAYLDGLWSINQFANIKNSEQTHMNAVENLLNKYNLDYTILPVGEFENQDLQILYNQFVIDGAVNTANALQIGATIEDLDIVDLQSNLDATTNSDVISVFEMLQCGSRNHLRSFVSSIEISGSTYIPQFLTQDWYDSILSASHEQCN